MGLLAALTHEGEEAEAENRAQMAVGTIEMMVVNQVNFISENREYIELGSLGTNPNLH